MRIFIFFTSLFFYSFSFAQRDSLQLGDSYGEDQIYLTISYSQLNKQPVGISNSEFSYSFSAGYFKDFILTRKGNISIALGVGYGFDSFNHGFEFSRTNNKTIINLNLTKNTNKLTLHQIEFPFEFRWRTSNANKYKFWRIYTGIKLTYNYSNNFIFENNSYKNIERFNKWQYGYTLSTGYDLFNIQLFYGFTPILKNSSLGEQIITTKMLKIGFIFYIL